MSDYRTTLLRLANEQVRRRCDKQRGATAKNMKILKPHNYGKIKTEND